MQEELNLKVYLNADKLLKEHIKDMLPTKKELDAVLYNIVSQVTEEAVYRSVEKKLSYDYQLINRIVERLLDNVMRGKFGTREQMKAIIEQQIRDIFDENFEIQFTKKGE